MDTSESESESANGHQLVLTSASNSDLFTSASNSEEEVSSEQESDIVLDIRAAEGHAGRLFNVTFLNPKLKVRQHPGIFVQNKWPPTCSRHTPNKHLKFMILRQMHHYFATVENASMRAFQAQYRNYHRDWQGSIRKLSIHTLQKYKQNFGQNSANFKKLERYIKNNSLKRTLMCQRFYVDPEKTHYGVAPIFEEYLVLYREVVANEYHWRSIRWMVWQGKRILNNDLLVGILRQFMSNQEWSLMPLLVCTESYIRKLVFRHHLAIVRTSSDRKMSNETYITARPSYLGRERAFRRAIGVILQRPADYDDDHQEIWCEGQMEIWDASREFNLDEVPFAMLLNSKQIVSETERASLVNKHLTMPSKYNFTTSQLHNMAS
eukprot:569331_1